MRLLIIVFTAFLFTACSDKPANKFLGDWACNGQGYIRVLSISENGGSFVVKIRYQKNTASYEEQAVGVLNQDGSLKIGDGLEDGLISYVERDKKLVLSSGYFSDATCTRQ